MINIILSQHQVLIENSQNKMWLPQTHNIKHLLPNLELIYHSDSYFVATINNELIPKQMNDKLAFVGLRLALQHLDHKLIKEIVYYQQLNDYFKTHRFCGRCGSKTIRGTTNKFVFCLTCKQESYPHIAPCVMVRVHYEDKILMARGVNHPHGIWGLIAGFVEIGETLEECVIREVKEEVNLEIKDIKYWGSQPWPYPNNSLMVGFTAQYKSGVIIPQVSEIEEAKFCNAEQLPNFSKIKFSLASRMILEFCNK